MKRRALYKTTSLLVCIVLLGNISAFAKDVGIDDMVVTNNRDDLLLFLKVKGAFKKNMEEAINNGIPTTFSFFIYLEYPRFPLPDKKLAKIKLTHTVKYNSLKKNYIVTRSWEKNKPLTTASFEEAKKLMSEVKSLKVVSLSRLKKGTRYKIKAKAELDKVTLPFFLNYILFFVALWDFETNWHTVDFVYE